jgi:hypothetical protein
MSNHSGSGGRWYKMLGLLSLLASGAPCAVAGSSTQASGRTLTPHSGDGVPDLAVYQSFVTKLFDYAGIKKAMVTFTDADLACLGLARTLEAAAGMGGGSASREVSLYFPYYASASKVVEAQAYFDANGASNVAAEVAEFQCSQMESVLKLEQFVQPTFYSPWDQDHVSWARMLEDPNETAVALASYEQALAVPIESKDGRRLVEYPWLRDTRWDPHLKETEIKPGWQRLFDSLSRAQLVAPTMHAAGLAPPAQEDDGWYPMVQHLLAKGYAIVVLELDEETPLSKASMVLVLPTLPKVLGSIDELVREYGPRVRVHVPSQGRNGLVFGSLATGVLGLAGVCIYRKLNFGARRARGPSRPKEPANTKSTPARTRRVREQLASGPQESEQHWPTQAESVVLQQARQQRHAERKQQRLAELEWQHASRLHPSESEIGPDNAGPSEAAAAAQADVPSNPPLDGESVVPGRRDYNNLQQVQSRLSQLGAVRPKQRTAGSHVTFTHIGVPLKLRFAVSSMDSPVHSAAISNAVNRFADDCKAWNDANGGPPRDHGRY